MSKREITPGEWIFDAGDRGDPSVGLGPVPPTIIVQTEQGECATICALEEPCYRDNREPTDEMDECVTYLGDLGANGHLIATAPKLLKACQEALDLLSDDVAADCRWCQGEGSWTNRKPHEMIPVRHRAGCPILLLRSTIAEATGGVTS